MFAFHPHRCITGITRANACPSSFFFVLPHTLYITSATRTTCSMRITCATCASLSCVHYGYSGRPRRGSSDMQDRRLAQTWGLLRRNWSIPVAFQRGWVGVVLRSIFTMYAAAAGFMKFSSVSAVTSA